MYNADNVIVTPWKIEEVPLEHWFRLNGDITRLGQHVDPCKIVRIGDDFVWMSTIGTVTLETLATHYLHSAHPVGPNADWQRCGHVEQRGVVWVGRDDLYFRSDTAVINGVRYAVDGAEAVTVSVNTGADDAKLYPFVVKTQSGDVRELVTANGEYYANHTAESSFDVVPAIRMEAK